MLAQRYNEHFQSEKYGLNILSRSDNYFFRVPKPSLPPLKAAGWVFLRVKNGLQKPFFTLKLPKIRTKQLPMLLFSFKT